MSSTKVKRGEKMSVCCHYKKLPGLTLSIVDCAHTNTQTSEPIDLRNLRVLAFWLWLTPADTVRKSKDWGNELETHFVNIVAPAGIAAYLLWVRFVFRIRWAQPRNMQIFDRPHNKATLFSLQARALYLRMFALYSDRRRPLGNRHRISSHRVSSRAFK